MTWFVASLHDEDTHLNENSTGATVTARCGPSFAPWPVWSDHHPTSSLR
jgi:hypothetical protein